MRFLTSLLCFVFVVSSPVTLADEVKIYNAQELVELSNNVSSGVNYYGTTVYLESDIDFTEELSKKFKPIGTYRSHYFNGTFDGKGYTISNFVINLTTTSVNNAFGIFGYTKGMTLRNVIFDSSNSVTATYILDDEELNTMVGTMIGYCNGMCVIDNVVNMANVTSLGKSNILVMGGIVGYIGNSHSNGSIIRNCVNYGYLTSACTTKSRTNIGGICGYLEEAHTKTVIENCVNYGIIKNNAPTWSSARIGGIHGRTGPSMIKNCLSVGNIIPFNESDCVGSIGGANSENTNIANCYWTEDVGCNRVNGSGSPTVTNSFIVSEDLSTVNRLNDYALENNCNKWVLNTNNLSIAFKVYGRKDIQISSRIILLPDIIEDSDISTPTLKFSGWYTDENYANKLTASETAGYDAFYGLYGALVSIVFDVNGGDSPIEPKYVLYNSAYGVLPEAQRIGYTFDGWYTDKNGGDSVTSNDIAGFTESKTVFAHWSAIAYTVTFEFVNGTKSTVGNLHYQDSISYPEVHVMEGYTFSGWSNYTEFMPPNDHTVVAQMVPNNYVVTFDVNGENIASVPSINVTFNSTYGVLPIPTRNEYLFVGWFTDSNESVTSETIVKIANNHTLYAQWKKVSNQVEIIFEKKELTKDDIEQIVNQYTDSDFTIVIINDDKSSGTRVIIKFTDIKGAENFIENINASSDNDVTKMITIGYNYDNLHIESLSTLYRPCAFFNLISI